MTTTQTRPMTKIEAAAYARSIATLRKQRRWAQEMRAAGWTVAEPADSKKP